MKGRRRTSDDSLFRETAIDGTADAVAFGTMAIGLVVGTMDQLAPAWSVNARYGHGVDAPLPAVASADQLVSVAQTAQAPPTHHVTAFSHGLPPPDAARDVTPEPHASMAEPWQVKEVGNLPSPMSAVPAVAHDLSSNPPAPLASDSAQSHTSAAFGEPGPLATTPEAAIAGIAQHVSDSMGALVEQMRSLSASSDVMPSLVQHATDIGDIAGQMLQEISSSASKGIDGLSEVLGGPRLDLVTSSGPSDLQGLPASILGAVTNVAGTGHDNNGGLPVFHAAPLESLHVDAAVPVADHAPPTIVEMPPLQLGFLGQSYTDVADHHDNGSHSLTSPLHGFI